jgi:hypothetical protein
MVRKLVVGALAVALFVVNSSAQFYTQNARIEALGGAFIVDDPSDILRYTAYINNYTNDAQITFNSPIWGVKSFGPVFNFGVLANKPLLLDNPAGANFYDTSSFFMNRINGINGLDRNQNIPHVLLGFNLSVIRLGFDLFWENSHFKQNIDDNPTAGPHVVTDVKGTVNDPGFIASIIFGSKEVPITAKYGISFPGISAKSEIESTPAAGTATTTTTEIESKKGMYLTGGLEIGFTTNKLNWTAGLDDIYNHFQFKNASGTTLNGTELDNNFFNNLNAYAGFTAEVDSSSFVTLLYDFRFRTSGHGPEDQTYANRRYSTNLISNIISAGYENTWNSAWVFDKFVARVGLNYQISSQVDHVKGDGTGGSFSERTKHETVYSQIDPRIGLGIVKKVFSLDVTVHPTAWAGLISGPAVGTVTATLIF